VAAAFLSFATLVVTFAMWIFDHTKDSADAELLPNPQSGDSRRGFENFVPFIENLLLGAVCFFFVFFMTRIDALYVYSDSPSISSFVGQNIFLRGFAAALKDPNKGPGWLFDFGNTVDPSTTLVTAGFCLAAILGFLVPSFIVRQAAIRSQQRYLNRLRENPKKTAALHRITPEEAELRISNDTKDNRDNQGGKRKETGMEFWPLHYPKFQLLLVFVSFAGICFACYRLTFTIVLMLFVDIVRKAMKAMGLLSEPSAGAAPVD
jgi:hypothetical protein